MSLNKTHHKQVLKQKNLEHSGPTEQGLSLKTLGSDNFLHLIKAKGENLATNHTYFPALSSAMPAVPDVPFSTYMMLAFSMS